jgi:drug/metabolite transporter (DMT)-like permease
MAILVAMNIFLAVLSSLAVALLIGLANKKHLPILQVLLWNYLFATIISLPFVESAITLHWKEQLLAVFLGFFYVITILIYRETIKHNGVSTATTASRTSASLPILFSILLFTEIPGPYAILGILLSFAAIPLSIEKSKSQNHRIYLPLILFLAFGVNDFMLKFRQLIPQIGSLNSFLFIVFLSAAALTGIIILIKKDFQLSKTSIYIGLAVGMSNFGSAFFLGSALENLSGPIVYALVNLGIIAGGTLAGRIIWKETINYRRMIFLTLAAVSIVLINIG